MAAVRGYYDGKCVQLLDKLSVKKNQPVLVTVIDEQSQPQTAEVTRSNADTDTFRDALLTGRYVIPTDIDADTYIAELRSNDRV